MKITESKLKAIVSAGTANHVDVVSGADGIRVLVTKTKGGSFTVGSERNDVRIFKSMDTVTDFLSSVGIRSFSVINNKAAKK